MSDREDFALDYNKVGLGGLCELLIAKRIGKTDLRQIPSHCLNDTFSHRFIMFILIVYMKSMKLNSKALNILKRWTGYDYLYNIVTKKLQDTQRKNSHEDPRYKSALAMRAAKTAYESRDRVRDIVKCHWKMKYIDFFDCVNEHMSKEESTEMGHPTQAFMFSDRTFKDNTGDQYELICVAFRGTVISSVDDLCTDLDIFGYPLKGYGKVHAGFLKALGVPKVDEDKNPSWPKELDNESDTDRYAYYKIRKVLKERLGRNKYARFIVTGHSLGGALAVLFTTILGFHEEKNLLNSLEGVYTFGQPKVGDRDFGKSMEKSLGRRYFRFVYAHDLVPKLPFNVASAIKYEHFGTCYYFNIFYIGKVIEGIPKEKYYITELICACIEFWRSLIFLSLFPGRDYREGIVRLGIRALAMVTIPGLSAHMVEDYVNLTRLGSRHTFTAMKDIHYLKFHQ